MACTFRRSNLRALGRCKTLGIPLNATAMEILRGQIGWHDEYVFVYQGKPLSATVNTARRNALKKSGIENFRFHDTRHTWASLLIQNGVPKGMIKEMGGWKSVSVVERYAHLASKHLARHAAVLDALLPLPETSASSRLGVYQGLQRRNASSGTEVRRAISIALNVLWGSVRRGQLAISGAQASAYQPAQTGSRVRSRGEWIEADTTRRKLALPTL
jgi:hypothetical protein